MSKRHVAYTALAFLILAMLFVLMSRSLFAKNPTVVLAGETVRVTIADTEAKREQGLSGRQGLAPHEGMLFIFQKDDRYAFWMKDMLFSIDILWLSADGTVVYIAPSVSPDTYPQAFVSSTPARYVLELPAGYAAAHGVKLGDKVQL